MKCLFTLCFVFWVAVVHPCPNLTYQQTVEEGIVEKETEKLVIKMIEAESDLIFIAIASETFQVDEEDRIYVSFTNIVEIKGRASENTFYYDKDNAYTFEYSKDYLESKDGELVETGIIRYGCKGRYDLITGFQNGFRHLVYIKSGRILRENLFIDWQAPFEAGQEVEFLDSLD